MVLTNWTENESSSLFEVMEVSWDVVADVPVVSLVSVTPVTNFCLVGGFEGVDV